MNKIEVILESYPTPEQLRLITGAARMTMTRGALPGEKPFSHKIFKRLCELKHGTPLEHAHVSFTVVGASRVFLAQITRHRMMSPTSGSQQYQLHDGFDYVVPPFEDESLQIIYRDLMEECDAVYKRIEKQMGRDWARYVLPGACRNNLLLTMNLREFFTVIVPLRACRRNTPETRYVVAKMLGLLLRDAGLFMFIEQSGPACLTEGKCDQGDLCCGFPFGTWSEMLEVDR